MHADAGGSPGEMLDAGSPQLPVTAMRSGSRAGRGAGADTGCPCGSGLGLAKCCGRHIEGGEPAPTAEALMRSRYAAYALGVERYLLATWHPSTRPPSLDLAAEPHPRWIGLQVKRHHETDAEHAVVEFVARCKVGGRAHGLHEVSRFVRENGQWFYLAGEVTEA